LKIDTNFLHAKLDDAALWHVAITTNNLSKASQEESRERFKRIEEAAIELADLMDTLGTEHRLSLLAEGYESLPEIVTMSRGLGYAALRAGESLIPGKDGPKQHAATRIMFGVLSRVMKDHEGRMHKRARFILDCIDRVSERVAARDQAEKNPSGFLWNVE
jgi:hypothetical protein